MKRRRTSSFVRRNLLCVRGGMGHLPFLSSLCEQRIKWNLTQAFRWPPKFAKQKEENIEMRFTGKPGKAPAFPSFLLPRTVASLTHLSCCVNYGLAFTEPYARWNRCVAPWHRASPSRLHFRRLVESGKSQLLPFPVAAVTNELPASNHQLIREINFFFTVDVFVGQFVVVKKGRRLRRVFFPSRAQES